ncbi:MAG: aminotransferase class I/II-fold pyridoxal phosphate-dependent enzyme [Chloroflexota bacterium]|nr:aminotransferase class I/II-fold pyridoxal phosphate-dependent enzyme [Chloroflexota bacterium]
MEWGIHTRAIHAGEGDAGADVARPIHMANTFSFESAAQAAHAFAYEDMPIYTRWGNPTVERLGQKVAALEGAEAGLALASGMAAISTALLTALSPGDHLIATTGLYSATYHLVEHDLPRMGIESSLAEATDPEAFAAALRPNTRAIYLESPGNPNFALNDIVAIVEIARANNLLTLIDNTFATPINQQPHALGVDVVVHSATKFLGGHGDAIAGVITGPAEFMERALKGVVRNLGGVLSPFNAWLVARGIQTFPLRMARHNENALALSHWLAEHPAVREVRYPFHPSHPQYDLARRQMRGGGGVLVFELKGGYEAGRQLLNRVQLCTLTVSLGDTKTLITHPASTTHASVPRDYRLAYGIPDGLVRLAVGLEDVEDLMADLDQAMQGEG